MTALLILLLFLAVVGLVYVGLQAFDLWKKVRQLNSDLADTKAQHQQLSSKYAEDANRWKQQSEALKADNQRLHKWKGVADADAKAEELVRKAQAILAKANTDAKNLIAVAQQQASALLADTQQKADAQQAFASDKAAGIESAAKQQAQAILDSATSQAAQIVETANKKAEEIAGAAFEAKRNATRYEQIAKAMKNVIEGYGDEYIIPEHSLLDDLAQDFGHTQAGQELKNARERTKTTIRNGTAAVCDYVEANRRQTAIDFVTDAFKL